MLAREIFKIAGSRPADIDIKVLDLPIHNIEVLSIFHRVMVESCNCISEMEVELFNLRGVIQLNIRNQGDQCQRNLLRNWKDLIRSLI
jgi:hypothetical protein